MYRTSVAILKSKKPRELQMKPQQGTMRRLWYDEFVSNPCKPIEMPVDNTAGHIRDCLRDYGLDIRHHSAKHYWLVGQYDEHGKYTDYLAQRLT